MMNNNNISNNQIINDFLVTTQVNTLGIEKSQMQKDLEFLKKKERDKQYKGNAPIMIKKRRVLPRILNITDVDVLKLTNPFKGV